MINLSLTMKSWETYNPAKTLVWNIIHMPKCAKCNNRYGTEVWNDDDNIKSGNPKTNAPVKVTRYGLDCYYCPTCAKEIKKSL